MLKVLFFASIREQLGRAQLELEWTDQPGSFAQLENKLLVELGDAFANVLAQDNLIRSINHQVVDASASIGAGDEVAYFPPVTGG